MNHTYIKFHDTGLLNDKIIYVGESDPAENHRKLLNLQKNPETGEWFTYLGSLIAERAELVSVTPYEEEQIGRKIKRKNIYIFKVEEADAYIE